MAAGRYVIMDTAGNVLREEPAPQSLCQYEASRQKLARLYHEINELMQSPNPLTQKELQALFEEK